MIRSPASYSVRFLGLSTAFGRWSCLLLLAGLAHGQVVVDVTPNGPLVRCTGQSAAFSAGATGGVTPYSFQWTKNGFPIGGATASTFSVASAALADEGTYNCIVTDSTTPTPLQGQDPTGTFLDVQQPVQINTQPANAAICVGVDVSFTATYAGDPAPTVQWEKVGIGLIIGGPTGNGSTYVVTSGGGTTTLTIQSPVNLDAGSYRVTVSNTCGTGTFSETSTSAVLTADTTPPTFGNCPPATQTVPTDPGGCTATFSYTPMATDDCGVATVTQTLGPAFGGGMVVLAPGTHNFEFEATDTAGLTATCTFEVVVTDQTPPVITAPTAPVFVVESPANSGGATVAFSVSALDNCDGVIVPTCVPASGTTFPLGRTQVTCAAIDSAGNPSSVQFDVFVCATAPPLSVSVDDDWAALALGVDPDGPGPLDAIGCDAFATIQDGIDAVGTGGVVSVAPGSYAEALSLGKSISLQGARSGMDARVWATTTPSSTTESVIVLGSGTLLTLTSGCAGSTIDGFALVGGTRSIASTSGPLDGLTLRNNYCGGFTGSAIFLDDNGEDVTLHRNVCDGFAKTSTGGTVHLDTNTFHGFHMTCNHVRNGPGTAMFVDGNRNVGTSGARNPLIQQNLFENMLTGSAVNVGKRSLQGAVVEDNVFRINGFDGLQGGPKDTIIRRNIFENNGRFGLSFTSFGDADPLKGAQGCSALENCFLSNGGAVSPGGDVFFSAAQAPGTISTNSLTANSLTSATAVVYDGTETLNCSANWWGMNTGPSVANHPAGTGNAIAGTGGGFVDFTPWLDNGTDTDTFLAGCQPDFALVHIDDDSPQSGADDRVLEGVTVVNAGGTVRVHPGDIPTNNDTISKACTIEGTTSGVARLVATLDTGTSGDARGWFVVTVSGVTWRRLTFDGDSGSGRSVWQALRLKEGGTVDLCAFQNVRSAPAATYNGIAVASFKNASVTTCTFQNIGRIGIILFGSDVTAGVISGNVYTGKGVGDHLDYGVELGGGAVATVSGNTISQCLGFASTDGSKSAGVLATTFSSAGTTLVLTGSNSIQNNVCGVALGFGAADSTTATIIGNTITNNTLFGINGIGGGLKARIQGNDLRNNGTTADPERGALFVSDGALFDAGDCTNSNVTGLGSSTGQNNLSGYGADDAPPWAAYDGNASASLVSLLAQNNTFGIGSGTNLELLFFDDSDTAGANTMVLATQIGGLLATCPSNASFACVSQIGPVPTDLAGFLAAGGTASTSSGSVVVTDSDVGTVPCNFVRTRTYTINDGCGNQTQCVQTITVQDTVPPMVTSGIPSITIECGDDTSPAGAAGVFAFSDNCGGSVTVGVSDVVTSGTCPVISIITRSWTASDGCSNQTVAVQVITVRDTTAPVVSAPADVTIECDASSAPANTGTAMAMDACSPTVTLSHVDAMTPGSCGTLMNITRTWTAVDPCGNTGSAVQTITLQDTTPPVITVFPADQGLECQSAIPVPNVGLVSGTDNCGTATASHVGDVSNGGSGCTGNPLVVSRTYRLMDACGLFVDQVQTFTVIDITPPVITGFPADESHECPNQIPAPNIGLVTASDNCAGAVTVTHQGDTNNGGSGCVGDPRIVSRTYRASDACGLFVDQVQTFTVIDITPPTVISSPSNQTVQCPSDVPASNTSLVVATDLCGGTVTVSHEGDVLAGVNPATLTRTYRASDPCGNFVDVFQVFTIQDTVLPVITTCAPATTVPAGPTCTGAMPDLTGSVTATDNCSTTLVITQSVAENDPLPLGPTTVTLTVTDEANNSATCQVIVTVEDQTPPDITCPPDITRNCNETKDPYGTGMVSATDNCSTNLSISHDDDRSGLSACNATGTIVRTWTVMDQAGNPAICVQTITVVDTVPPVVGPCPPDVLTSNDPGVCSGTVAYATPEAFDTCYREGFEDAAYESGKLPNQPSVSFNDWNTLVTRVPSGTGGVPSSEGGAHALFTSPPTPTTGPFSRLGGYTNSFGTGFRVALDVYVDLNDPAITGSTPTAGYGFDVSTAVNQPSGIHLRDFIFHAAAYGPGGPPGSAGGVVIAGSNGTNFLRRNDLLSLNHAIIGASGWYTLEWVFRDAGALVLAVDLNLRDSLGTLLFTETLSTPTDIIGSTVGGNRYTWFTVLETQALHVDHLRLDRNAQVSCSLPSGSTFPVVGGPSTVTCSATDDCGNTGNCTFTITVTDSEAPVITCPAATSVEWGTSTDPSVTGMPTATDNCDLPGAINLAHLDGPNVPGSCPNVFSFVRTWTATDTSNNAANCTQTITLTDMTPPVLTVPPSITIECGVVGTSPSETGGPATATDLCDPNPVVTFTDVVSSASCPVVSVITRTWKATDLCGNMVTAPQIITVRDTMAPSITCPGPVTVACVAEVPPVSIGSVTATDLCAPGSVTIVHVSDSPLGNACGGTIMRVYAASDPCGNTAQCTQVITVDDTVPPVLVGVPADTTVSCTAVLPVAPTVTATDNCASPAVVFSETTTPGPCAGSSVVVRMWSATDDCNNTTTGTQTITVVDTTPPVLGTIPGPVTIQCSDPVPTAPAVTATDSCDPAPSVVLSEVSTPGACVGASTLVRTWTATDACGNNVAASQTITIVDTTVPVLLGVPADATIACSDPVPPVPTVTATDLCDPAPGITFGEVITPGACTGNQTIVRTWTATDSCGNSDFGMQTITVVDTVMPVLVGVPADATQECSDPLPPPASVTATDLCDPTPSVTLVETTTPGACTGSSTVVRTWTATDSCGNSVVESQTITLEDTTAPVLVGVPSDVTIECDVTVPPAATVTATDNCDPGVVVTFGEVTTPGTCVGSSTIVRTWSSVDSCGNPVSATQTITVVDTTTPILAGVPADITQECDVPLPAPAVVTVTDNCDLGVTVAFSETSVPGCAGVMVFTRTWTSTDSCGNTATGIQVITQVDTTDPVLVGVPTDITVECSDPLPPPAVVTATDNCDPSPTVTPSESTTPGTCIGSSTLTRTWTATDGCGNSVSASQIITIVDTMAPVLTGVPADQTIECDDPVPPVPVVTSVDNCDPLPSLTFGEVITPGACVGSSTIARTWTSVDSCGNPTTATWTITVEDTTAPVLIGVPGDTTLECSDPLPPPAAVTATDNCDPNPSVTLSEVTTPGACQGAYVLVRTWTATDSCSNATSAFQTITVQDTTLPVISGCPSNISVDAGPGACAATVTWTAPTATDNCFVTLTSTHAPGSSFGLGTTTVTYTATDGCNTVVCTFTVTVVADWKPRVDYAVGLSPEELVLVDLGSGTGATPFMPDGHVDIVTANSGDDTLSILFNDGNGGFVAATPLFLGAADAPAAVAAGNLVAGGGVDLVVACRGTDALRIVENTGTSLLVGAPMLLPTGAHPVAVAVGQLNAAGTDDVVFAAEGDVFGTGRGLGVVLDGVLGLPLPAPPAGSFRRPADVALCDLDADAALDLIAVETSFGGNSSSGQNVLLYQNDGLGGFTPAGAGFHLDAAFEPFAVCCGDLNADGIANDIAVVTAPAVLVDPGSTHLYINTGVPGFGSGSFNPPVVTPVGRAPRDIACGDLQRDSLVPNYFPAMDLVAVNFGSSGAARVSVQVGFDPVALAFTSSNAPCDVANVPVAVALGDLSSDTLPDMVIVNRASNSISFFCANVRALGTPFGTGCTGFSGIPIISGPALAVHGQLAEVRLTNASPSSPVILGVSGALIESSLGPCTIYLGAPVTTFALATNGAGEASFIFLTPPAPSFTGAEFFAQWAIFDAAGAFGPGVLAVSDALRVRVGF